MSQVPKCPVTEGWGLVEKPGEMASMRRASEWYEPGGRDGGRCGVEVGIYKFTICGIVIGCPTFWASGVWKIPLPWGRARCQVTWRVEGKGREKAGAQGRWLTKDILEPGET